jgi:uncharacterized membrane protein (DUF106 family)
MEVRTVMKELAPLIWIVALLVPAWWWLNSLVQALKVPDSQWREADQSKGLYVALMIVLGLIGTILYASIARPALREAGWARIRAEEERERNRSV